MRMHSGMPSNNLGKVIKYAEKYNIGEHIQ